MGEAKPGFLLGGFGGRARGLRRIIGLIADPPPPLDLRRAIPAEIKDWTVNDQLRNGLNEDENKELAVTTEIGRVTTLAMRDLSKA